MQRHGVVLLAVASAAAGLLFTYISKDLSGLLSTLPWLLMMRRWVSLFISGFCAVSLGVAYYVSGDQFLSAWGGTVVAALAFAAATTIGRNLGSAMSSADEAKLIVESMPGLGWAADASGQFTYVSPSVTGYVGKTRSEFNEIGMTGLEAVHPDDVERVTANWNRCLETGEEFQSEHRILSTVGTYSWFRAIGRPTLDAEGRPTGWYGTTINIDQQKSVEEEVKRSALQLRTLIDVMPALAWCTDREGNPTYFSERTLLYLGLSGKEMFEEPFRAMHPADTGPFKESWARSVETGGSFRFIYRLRRSDGVFRWHEGRAEAARDPSGQIVQWYGINVDVHEQVEAEGQLRASEAKLRRIFDTVPVSIWSADPDGSMTYMNRRLLEYSGMPLDSYSEERTAVENDHRVHANIDPLDVGELQQIMARSIETGQPFGMRYRHRRHDGVYRWVDLRAEALKDSGDEISQWYGAMIDIHEEVETRQELRSVNERLVRAMQVATLSEVSASIAHELKQPLSAIVADGSACLHWLDHRKPDLDTIRESTQRVVQHARDAAGIVDRTKALFKHEEPRLESVDINSTIREVYELSRDVIAQHRIQTDFSLTTDDPWVMADTLQLQQVLTNLIKNAVESLIVADQQTRRLEISSWRGEDDTVGVQVRDSGIGLDDPKHIFEPFFSTKGDGMGMGLAICASIIASLGGRIWAAPNTPSGATFTFALPIATAHNSRMIDSPAR